jgi:hypothetical protein
MQSVPFGPISGRELLRRNGTINVLFERMSLYRRGLTGVVLWAALIQHVMAQQSVVLFDVCASSATWIRPSANVQSKIWNDPRYRDVGPHAFEWTHRLIPAEPDSASIQDSIMNLSGVWTDVGTNQCPWRGGERGQWTEIWSLHYHITGISLSGLVYTVDVVPLERGYEIIQFRRPQTLGEALTRLRFTTPHGRVLTEWRETSPSAFDPK